MALRSNRFAMKSGKPAANGSQTGWKLRQGVPRDRLKWMPTHDSDTFGSKRGSDAIMTQRRSAKTVRSAQNSGQLIMSPAGVGLLIQRQLEHPPLFGALSSIQIRNISRVRMVVVRDFDIRTMTLQSSAGLPQLPKWRSFRLIKETSYASGCRNLRHNCDCWPPGMSSRRRWRSIPNGILLSGISCGSDIARNHAIYLPVPNRGVP